MSSATVQDPAGAFRGSTVLVTGAAGFIGSHLTERLVRAGARVTAIDRLADGTGACRKNLEHVESQIRFLVGDLRDQHVTADALAGAEVVFHLAGRAAHEGSMEDPMADLQDNAEATLVLLQAWHDGDRRARFVFSGTRQVYGPTDGSPVSEEHPTVPTDINGWNKLAAEGYFRAFHRTYGLQATLLRLTNTYGPRMSAANGFLGVWLSAVAGGRSFEVYGTGEVLRQVIYVDDAVDCLLLSGTPGSGTPVADGEPGCRCFNVAGPSCHSLRQIADELVTLGGHYELRPAPDLTARIGIGSFQSDDCRVRRELGWQPRIDLRTGLARTLSTWNPVPSLAAGGKRG